MVGNHKVTRSGEPKMSDTAESPTETQKEETQPPSDDSTTNDEKKKSKRAENNFSVTGKQLCF